MATKDATLSRSANAKLEGADALGVRRPTLQQLVAAWKHKAPRAPPEEHRGGAKLHQKFSAAGDSFTFKYGSISEFFGGLEGMVGSPSADLMQAMKRDHASEEPFEAWNADVKRTTTPRVEWVYVAEGRAGETIPDPAAAAVAHEPGRGRQPSHVKDETEGRKGWRLEDFAAQPEIVTAGLMLPEVAGIRLYTGCMFKLYNDTLRLRTKGAFVTTLHAINSGIVKLSRLTKAATVYRGVSGGVLPEEFWEPNAHGVIGGVELGFMSTSTERDVALGYMKQSSKTAQILFEIRMGMVDRGADVSCLSQFPAEKEILFAPLTGLEVAAVPRDELGVLIVELRLSCNLHDQTLEQVVGKMQTSHIALLDSMMDDLKLGVTGMPPSVLKPLEDLKVEGLKNDHALFRKPKKFLAATKAALEANDACYAKLAAAETWARAEGDGPAVAEHMRVAATKCATEERPKEAAALLMMAVERSGVPQENKDRVGQACPGLSADQQRALEAASLLLESCAGDGESGAAGMWMKTLAELGTHGGDRHTVGKLAEVHGLPPSRMWHVMPMAEFPDLPFDQYKSQPLFHQVNTAYPGLQLVHEEPYIMIVQGFADLDECKELIEFMSLSRFRTGSATGSKQEEVRTSTQVLLSAEDFPELCERLARVVNLETSHFEPAKLTHYAKGEYFHKHHDGSASDEKNPVEMTAFLYLNDVSDGGSTVFNDTAILPQFYSDVKDIDTIKGREWYTPWHTSWQLPSPSTADTPSPLRLRPRAGMLVIHFPSTRPEYMSIRDPNVTHESEAAIQPKYIVQQFIRCKPLSQFDRVDLAISDSRSRNELRHLKRHVDVTKTTATVPKGLPPGA